MRTAGEQDRQLPNRKSKCSGLDHFELGMNVTPIAIRQQ